MGHTKTSFYRKALCVMVLKLWEENRGVEREDFCITAVYFCGKSLLGKTCIWGTWKAWHFTPWLYSLELPFAWWHLKLDHPGPPSCQTAATLARGSSRGKGRGCLLKEMNKCLLRAPISPNKQLHSKGFSYLVEPEKVSCSREGQKKTKQNKTLLECMWAKITFLKGDC